MLFIGGGFGTVQNWSRVIRLLDGKYRSVRFDARARGKSGKSEDYSIQGAVDDVGRVIDAPMPNARSSSVGRGATLAAVHGPAPERVAGLVLIDGAYPITMFDEAGKEKIRSQFRRLGWLMCIAAALGRSARMSPAESAEVVIEMDAVNGELGPDFAALECPTVFAVETQAHRAPRRTRCARCGLLSTSPLGATSACPYSQRRPTNTPRSSARPPPPSSPRSRTSSTLLTR